MNSYHSQQVRRLTFILLDMDNAAFTPKLSRLAGLAERFTDPALVPATVTPKRSTGFVDGSLLSAIESGLVQRILRRVRSLHQLVASADG